MYQSSYIWNGTLLHSRYQLWLIDGPLRKTDRDVRFWSHNRVCLSQLSSHLWLFLCLFLGFSRESLRIEWVGPHGETWWAPRLLSADVSGWFSYSPSRSLGWNSFPPPLLLSFTEKQVYRRLSITFPAFCRENKNTVMFCLVVDWSKVARIA